jgi:hypothetical protein
VKLPRETYQITERPADPPPMRPASPRYEGRRAVIEEVAAHFDQLAKETPLGAAFHGGPLDGASIHNVHAHAARVVRALATREALAAARAEDGR